MRLFGSGLGSFLALSLDGSGSRGSQLKLPAGIFPGGGLFFPALVTNVSGQQRESVGYVKCFNDKNYMFAFGHDPASSTITVDFTTMLKNTCGGLNSIIADMTAAYKASRVSQSRALAQLTLGGSSDVYQGYIIAMATHTISPEHNLQGFSFTMGLLEAQ